MEDYPDESDLVAAWEDDHGDEMEAMMAAESEEQDDENPPFSSSPPTFTSPTSRMDQPSPMPSDLSFHRQCAEQSMTALELEAGSPIPASDDRPGVRLDGRSIGGLAGSEDSSNEQGKNVSSRGYEAPFIGTDDAREPAPTSAKKRRRGLIFEDDEDEVLKAPPKRTVLRSPEVEGIDAADQNGNPEGSLRLARQGKSLSASNTEDGAPAPRPGRPVSVDQQPSPQTREDRRTDIINGWLAAKSSSRPTARTDPRFEDLREEVFDRMLAPSGTSKPFGPPLNREKRKRTANESEPPQHDVFKALSDVSLRSPSRRGEYSNDLEGESPLFYPHSDGSDDEPPSPSRPSRPAIRQKPNPPTPHSPGRRPPPQATPAAASVPAVLPSKSNTMPKGVASRCRSNRAPQAPAIDYCRLPRTSRFRLATASSGTTLYFPFRRKPLASEGASSNLSVPNRPSLLGTSIHAMFNNLEAQQTKEAEDRSAVEFIAQQTQQLPAAVVARDRNDGGASKKAPKERLWVDKYSPRMYIDLVGDERINREVLTWVKEWDFCVFKKPRRKPANQKSEPEVPDFKRDPLQRPDKKVLLLTGPPGLGKTTLAHVIARHAGYTVSEINASDDRTGDSVKARLIGALETQSVLGARRPHLLVIDEIDGASSGGQGDHNFIKLLIDFITGEDRQPKAGSSKKATARRALLRPIICVCNDPYAPVLRPLRHLAQLVDFRPPPVKTLARRLHEICRWEGLAADLRTLTALCEMADGDIRSCLNTLQFLRKKTAILTLDVLHGVDVGQKDVGRGLFVVWDEIFMLPAVRGRKKINVVKDRTNETDQTDKYVDRISSLVASNGEYEKLLQGCHENYLRTKIFDTARGGTTTPGVEPPKSKIEQAMDWLAFFDALNFRVNVQHAYGFSGYMAYPAVAFHKLFAGTARVRCEYPRADTALYLAKQHHSNVLTNLLQAMPPPCRRTWTDPAALMLHLVSYLLSILSPELRMVNARVAKAGEAQSLARVVDVMAGLGFRFRQDRNEDGIYEFHLDPPIDELIISLTARIPLNSAQCALNITFNNKRLLGAPSAVKQMVSLEIDRERIRRAEAAALERAGPSAEQQSTAPVQKTSKKGVKPHIVKQLAIPAADQPEQIARDFFGRPVIVPPKPSLAVDISDSDNPPPLLQGKVAFRFNEGFSNAVRKTLYVRDFL
ncbi:hypothetical protein HDU87_007082 [Geranomyces variabilis]|uniref:AAA+ ATPase domain-containing protein n=1 Tax=Geranomyces variabilis TaxID=109894 RepID=A0AAD5TEI0_9FUNG|nr:hypothetical protein HDU87_007082 [Geranomyces variabilis]